MLRDLANLVTVVLCWYLGGYIIGYFLIYLLHWIGLI